MKAEKIFSESKSIGTTRIILSFLNPEEILHVREVSKYFLEYSKCLSGPYARRIQFIMATNGYYTNDPSVCLKRQAHWELYSTVLQFNPSSRQPALLHKMRDEDREKSKELSDSKYNNTRYVNINIYKPAKYCGHIWLLNVIWMLAHIHTQHPFAIVSKPKKKFLKRKKSDVYSAFSKEISICFKAHYTIDETLTHENYIYLTPTMLSRKTANFWKIKDFLEPTANEIESAYQKVSVYRR